MTTPDMPIGLSPEAQEAWRLAANCPHPEIQMRISEPLPTRPWIQPAPNVMLRCEYCGEHQGWLVPPDQWMAIPSITFRRRQ